MEALKVSYGKDKDGKLLIGTVLQFAVGSEGMLAVVLTMEKKLRVFFIEELEVL